MLPAGDVDRFYGRAAASGARVNGEPTAGDDG
jgi:hypothetical protein